MELTKEDKKLLENFPKYDGKGEFVGTQEYYEGIFVSETNRDPKLHEKFSELHTHLINEIIHFCKENNLADVDVVSLYADGLIGSIKYGEWGPCTDSSMLIYKKYGDETPFLHEI